MSDNEPEIYRTELGYVSYKPARNRARPLFSVAYNILRDPRFLPVDVNIFIDMSSYPSKETILEFIQEALDFIGVKEKPVNLRLPPDMTNYWPQNSNNPCAFWYADLETTEDSSK